MKKEMFLIKNYIDAHNIWFWKFLIFCKHIWKTFIFYNILLTLSIRSELFWQFLKSLYNLYFQDLVENSSFISKGGEEAEEQAENDSDQEEQQQEEEPQNIDKNGKLNRIKCF